MREMYYKHICSCSDRSGVDSSLLSLIHTGFLDTLFKLSQARAKCDLSNIITEDHALDVVEIIRDIMYDLNTDNVPILKSKLSPSKEFKRSIKLLQDYALKHDIKTVTMSDLKLILGEVDSNVIHMLNQNSYLLQNGNGSYTINVD
eukprot:NODE_3768_length_1292_cov_29.955518_g3298_i0.p1 GENE.NODE_3768_length_1292_cov_29.955518_g3298_i0~~NODE_3768_length_1292_cov_29.955518_g3298_i0.p1  ORF type:complete len:146 (+),score=22.26 NODE_3768_length_1292_cov_29.955518_g3298_i0:777-1214(+)